MRLGCLLALVVCSCAGSKPKLAPSNRCASDPAAGEVTKLQETTNPTLSGRNVGIANVAERELPGADGVVASRLSVMLMILDPETKETRRETVAADSVVTIGADRYCVVAVESGGDKPGSVSVRKLAL